MKNVSLWRTLRQSLAVLAAASVAAVGLSLPASATTEGGNPALIDAERTANLHVHKFEQPVNQGEPGNGLEQSTSGLTPLAGIEFQVQRVGGIDLTSNAGWEAAAELSLEDALAARTGAVLSQTTNASGDATFSGLDLGLYVVTENLTAAQLSSGITGSGPFIVALPSTHPNDLNTWLYDVHVYPKNNVDAITKTVQDAHATKLGDTISWTIDGSIPAGGVSAKYTITDQLDPRLSFAGAAVSINGSGSVSIAEGTDYTVSHSDGLVTIDFTAAGREKLDAIKKADSAAQVRVVIDTTVVSLGNGTIENQAILFPNDSNTEGIPSGKPVTKWGGIDILKTDSSNGNPLAGAEFQIFASQADAEAGTSPIVIDGQDTFASGADGRVHIDGLRLSNWADGAELAEADWKHYWVVESKAPDGYELLTTPQRVAVTDHDDATIEITVTNVPDNAGFSLPFTGGAGIWYFILVGLGVILVAGGVYLRSRFRKTAPIEA